MECFTSTAGLVLFLIGWIAPDPWKWYALVTLGPLFGPALSYLTFFHDLFPNPNVRGYAITTLLILPAFAYAQARFESHFLPRDADRLTVDLARTQLDLRGDWKQPVRYVGRLGDHSVFFETMTGNLVIVRLKDNEILVFNARRT